MSLASDCLLGAAIGVAVGAALLVAALEWAWRRWAS